MTSKRWQAPELIKKKVSSLSTAEKLSMLDGDLDFATGIKMLLQEDYYHRFSFPAGLIPQQNIAGVQFIDGPRGVVIQGGATTFPVPMARGASFDPDLEYNIGKAIGLEHSALGGNLFGGVCINLLRHPGWGRAQETYGEDSELLAQMGVALAKGAQENVMACVKHFAVNSMENGRFQINVRVSERVLHEVYLPHFKRVVQEAEVASVMSAYNALNGEWCGQHKQLLNDILKDTWGFSGFVLTDFIFGMRDAKTAILAGQDLEMPFMMHYNRFLPDLVKSGEVPETVIDEACARILYQQVKIADKKVPNKDIVGCSEHKNLAREAAARSFVLLKNSGETHNKPILPLKTSQTISVIGELANAANLGDHGSSDGRPDYVITPLAGIKEQVDNASQVSFNDGSDILAARECAKNAEVAVVVVGYTAEDEGEYIAPISLKPFADGLKPPGILNALFKHKIMRPIWRTLADWIIQCKRIKNNADNNDSFGRGGDRRNLNLSKAHENLIQEISMVNQNTVVLVMAGSAVLMEAWRDKVSGIMMIWYPGMEGGNAVADVLFGKRSPSGKLPFTIPLSKEDLPEFDPDATDVIYDESHGYQRLIELRKNAAFPFGFGLNYCSLNWSESTIHKRLFRDLETITLSIEIENLSDIDCYETVLLFIRSKQSDRKYPPVELKGFATQKIPAASKQTFEVSVPATNIGYYNCARGDVVYAPGIYEVTLARHAEDLRRTWHEISLL